MVRLGILGGTFDPIHNGHLAVAHRSYDALQLDKVLLVPAGTPPHKANRSITAAVHRQKMVELAIAGDPRLEISTVDLDRPGPHYSVDTLALLRRQYDLSVDDCFFIIGSDALIDLPTWHAPHKLLDLCRLAVIHRPGYQPDLAVLSTQLPGLSASIVWIEMEPNPISATRLRQLLALGESITDQTPPAVVAYIQTHHLYQ